VSGSWQELWPAGEIWDAIIVGGGLAGLSAAIYLGRAQCHTLVIDSAKSMAKWEPNVENYLGFPQGISGLELLKRGRQQAKRYGVHFAADEIGKASREATCSDSMAESDIIRRDFCCSPRVSSTFLLTSMG
jgi:thioredoxin reductase (NADPH)